MSYSGSVAQKEGACCYGNVYKYNYDNNIQSMGNMDLAIGSGPDFCSGFCLVAFE